jgi:IS30 family transposase
MSYKQLTEIERHSIKLLLKEGYKQNAIADRLGRTPSTISRELKRNTGLRGYRPQQAQRLADERQRLHSHTLITEETWQRVEQLLREEWSPEQISGRLKLEGLQSVSVEWIYQYILKDKQAGGDLYRSLRCQKQRKKRYGKTDTRGQIRNRTSIDDRPAIVDSRSRVGDWEMDLVIGQQGGAVLMTAVERKTRYCAIELSPDKKAESVKEAIIRGLSLTEVPVETLTYDNGKEFALHEEVSSQLDADAYFAHPYHSWERGLNENTNGLLRQYVPKGMSFNELTEEEVRGMMDKLNNRPRKCLDYKTPNEVLFGIKPTIALAS